jgi:hypothetical protein
LAELSSDAKAARARATALKAPADKLGVATGKACGT